MTTLDEAQIRRLLPDAIDGQLKRVDSFDEIGSTSSHLLAIPSPESGLWHFAIADRQTAGRGRGDKLWHSPAGGGLWMSGAYTISSAPENLSSLTLAIGIAVAKSLRQLGVKEIGLKWPNDLLVENRKLGGILLDSSATGGASTMIVCGLGINMDIGDPAAVTEATDHYNGMPPTDLITVLSDPPRLRDLAASMIETLIATLQIFEADGFAPFADEWPTFDVLSGRRVVVTQRRDCRSGTADGIAADGALIVRDGDTTHHIVSGTVRLSDDAEVAA